MLKSRLISLILGNRIHCLIMGFYPVFGLCSNRKKLKKDGFVEVETSNISKMVFKYKTQSVTILP